MTTWNLEEHRFVGDFRRSLPFRDGEDNSEDEMAVDAVFGELVSTQFPAIREIYREFPTIRCSKHSENPSIPLHI